MDPPRAGRAIVVGTMGRGQTDVTRANCGPACHLSLGPSGQGLELMFCTINKEHSYAAGLLGAAEVLGPGKQTRPKKTEVPPCPGAGCAPPFLRGLRHAPCCPWASAAWARPADSAPVTGPCPQLGVPRPSQGPASMPPPTWVTPWKAFLPAPQGARPAFAGLARGPQPRPVSAPFCVCPGIHRGSAAAQWQSARVQVSRAPV